MIHGKINLEDWRTARIEGEEPESVWESQELRLFFFGVLYNREVLQASTEDSNAKLAAEVFLTDSSDGFSCLDGSFTIIYYSEKECGIVRDHHGTHYSIYYISDGTFSSTWQFFKEQKEKEGYNPASLSAFLQYGLLKKDTCAISGISSLEAGERLLRNHSGEIKTLSLFSGYKVVLEKAPDIEQYSRRYGELHAQAIRRRIGDKRRVGILLSGGYDSGSNLAALRSIYDGEIDSFSVGFKGDTWTELPMARLMSQTFGTRHHEYEIDGSEISALPEIIRYLGEPFVEGGLMVNYCAMRMIGADKPEVILGGDGSDQYFGTTAREVALHYLAARTGLRPLVHGMTRFLSRETFDTGGKLSRINFHLDKMIHVLEGERFGFSDSALRGLLQHPKKDIIPPIVPKADTRSFEHLYSQHAIVSDLEIIINRIILFKASRMARMFDNNLTFPYMDLELYRFLQDLPIGLKCKGDNIWDFVRGRFVSKYLLKYHYKPLLPEPITSKKKQGGFAPMPIFFRDEAQRMRFKEFILSSSIMDDFLRRDAVEKFLINYDKEVKQTNTWFWYRQNRALQYFNLLALVIWWEEYIEGKEVKF